jgi:hypothetical protein
VIVLPSSSSRAICGHCSRRVVDEETAMSELRDILPLIFGVGFGVLAIGLAIAVIALILMVVGSLLAGDSQGVFDGCLLLTLVIFVISLVAFITWVATEPRVPWR